MRAHIDLLTTTQELDSVREQIIHIYQDVFSQPPWNESPEAVRAFTQRLSVHAQRPEFRCVIAYHTNISRLIGFAYGYTSASGQWWHNTVTAVLGAEEVERWFSNAFELVELAVLPTVQGQGIGTSLHNGILAGLSHRTAVTATLQADNPALHFYRQQHWVPIRANFRYPGSTEPHMILGRCLR